MGEIESYRRALLEPNRYAPTMPAAAHRAAHELRSQVQKEIAGVNAIVGCGEAVTRLPSDLPESHRVMAERIAISAAHMIRRLTR